MYLMKAKKAKMDLNFYKTESITASTVEGNTQRAGWIELTIREVDKSPVTITFFAERLGATPKIEESNNGN